MKKIVKYLSACCFFYFLGASISVAQELSLNSRLDAFQDYAANHPVEKIYLHLDKPYYAAGEYMYFCAYLTDMNLYRENIESGIIYVELSDAKKNLVKRVLLYSEENEFAGQMQLPDSLSAADYHLRAYTNYMRNAGEDFFYHRDIYIGNPTVPKQDVIPAKAFDYQVSFFPEGGQLLWGLSCKVAFKSLGNDGFGTDITGVLSDSEGNELLRFNSVHLGMGSFNFTPEKGKTYKATVQSNGMQKEYILPSATEGLALSARQDDKSIYLTIHSTDDKPDSIYIISQSRNTICYALNGFIKNHEQQIKIDKQKFPTGIAQFTLFKGGKPVSERLVFIDRKDDLHVSIVPDKDVYGDREKATVRIQVSDKDGEPVEGDFSLSVTDDRTVKPSFNEQNIKGSLLFAEDLKGYVESPGWYFSGDEPERAEALDNLLCTQGWTRFVWDKTSLPQTSDIYPVENEFQITGKVTNLIGKPVKNGNVILFSKENMFNSATTDEEGRFGFYGFNCPDTAVFVLQCRTKSEGKAFIGFVIDKISNKAPVTLFPQTKRNNKNIDDIMVSYAEQTGRQLKYRVINLPEVTVKGKRITDRETSGTTSARYSGTRLNTFNTIYDVIRSLPVLTKGTFALPYSLNEKRPDVWYIVDDGMKMADSVFFYIYGLMHANQFESVEVLTPEDAIPRYGMEFGSGAYIIHTKKFTGGDEIPDTSIEIVRPEGYCVRKEFYVPDYDEPERKQDKTPDLRTTIYWNPVIRTDPDGKASVSFFTADNTGTYSYVLEGIGDNKIGFIKR